MAAEDYTPRFVGDLSRPLKATFTFHDGSIDALTGASNLVLLMRNISSGQVTTGTGTWTITDATNGLATYAWGTNDVANSGFFTIWAGGSMPDGPTHWDDNHVMEIRKNT